MNESPECLLSSLCKGIHYSCSTQLGGVSTCCSTQGHGKYNIKHRTVQLIHYSCSTQLGGVSTCCSTQGHGKYNIKHPTEDSALMMTVSGDSYSYEWQQELCVLLSSFTTTTISLIATFLHLPLASKLCHIWPALNSFISKLHSLVKC